MAIFDEQIYEPFVARGLGLSGLAARQVMASNLPSLQGAINQSTATREYQQKQRLSQIKSQYLKGLPKIGASSGRSSGLFKNANAPIVLGIQEGDEAHSRAATVATPDGSGGFSLSKIVIDPTKSGDVGRRGLKALETLLGVDAGLLESKLSNLPIIKSNAMSSPFGIFSKLSSADLLSDISSYYEQGRMGRGTEISDLLKQIMQVQGWGGGNTKAGGMGGGGGRLPLSENFISSLANPNAKAEQRAWRLNKEQEVRNLQARIKSTGVL